MELATVRKSLQKVQEEKDQLQQELNSITEEKAGLQESMIQISEVPRTLIFQQIICKTDGSVCLSKCAKNTGNQALRVNLCTRIVIYS